ncbi:hypothetical protein GCM10018771_59780 [Streptomyces cellulosae]|nr:hypothetical protein GCM10018771_59780 [Streptomyces cellulosae]
MCSGTPNSATRLVTERPAARPIRARIELDRAYVEDLRDARECGDPRVVTPEPGWEWACGIHEGQVRRFARRDS